MTGKALTLNLKNYFDGLSAIDINLYAFDVSTDKELPCIVVGYEGETMTFEGGYGHYTVNGYTNICFQGYTDTTNLSADYYTRVLADALNNTDMFTSVNKPVSGTDTRPLKNFTLNGLFLRGIDRNIEGTSTEISIRFDAYCAAKD